MCLDRAGLVGEDGVTHHGVFDMAAFGCVPTLAIAAPMDELELRGMMYTGLQYGHPFMIRYPRGCGEGRMWRGARFETLPVGRGRKLRDGADVAQGCTWRKSSTRRSWLRRAEKRRGLRYENRIPYQFLRLGRCE